MATIDKDLALSPTERAEILDHARELAACVNDREKLQEFLGRLSLPQVKDQVVALIKLELNQSVKNALLEAEGCRLEERIATLKTTVQEGREAVEAIKLQVHKVVALLKVQ